MRHALGPVVLSVLSGAASRGRRLARVVPRAAVVAWLSGASCRQRVATRVAFVVQHVELAQHMSDGLDGEREVAFRLGVPHLVLELAAKLAAHGVHHFDELARHDGVGVALREADGLVERVRLGLESVEAWHVC